MIGSDVTIFVQPLVLVSLRCLFLQVLLNSLQVISSNVVKLPHIKEASNRETSRVQFDVHFLLSDAHAVIFHTDLKCTWFLAWSKVYSDFAKFNGDRRVNILECHIRLI